MKQISIFLENRQGTLFNVTDLLARNNIDIEAVSLADTTDFGIMRCIVDAPDKALRILKENGYTASTTDVIAVEVPDVPGGLSSVLRIMHENGLNVEYLYSFVRTSNEKAMILFRIAESNSREILESNGIKVLD